MSLLGLFEDRSLENPAIPLTDAGLASVLVGPPTDSGIPINPQTAMKMSAVYRATSLVSGLGGALPIQVVKRGTRKPADFALMDEPHPDLTKLELWRLTFVHRCLWGNCYLQKVYSPSGKVKFLAPISPDRVTPGLAKPIGENPSGKVFRVIDDHGEARDMTAREIMHIPMLGFDPVLGMSPVRMAAQAIGMSLAAEKFGARLFGSGNLMTGILQTDQKLTQQDAELLQQRWQTMNQGLDRSHRVAVLDSNAKFQSVTMPNNESQLLESRDFQITELARFFGLPPYLVMQTSKTTSWGTGLEQQSRGFTYLDLHPTWLAPTEQRITKELLPPDLEAVYDMTRLMRGDSIARAEYYRVMYEMGCLSPNDIRGFEDMPPRDGGDNYMMPLPAGATDSPIGTDPVLDSSLGPQHGKS